VRVLPPPNVGKKDGRPRMDDRRAMTAMLAGLPTGCPWQAVPRRLGAASTGHDRVQEWRQAQGFERLWPAGLLMYETLKGLEGEGQARDGARTKAPLGGEPGGQQPDRSRPAWDPTAPGDGRPGPAPRHRRGRRPSP
jgi:putative transposase